MDAADLHVQIRDRHGGVLQILVQPYLAPAEAVGISRIIGILDVRQIQFREHAAAFACRADDIAVGLQPQPHTVTVSQFRRPFNVL